jgi:hypothetical protein
VIGFLTVLGWIAVGLVGGLLLTRHLYLRRIVSVGRAARAPVCTSCPFVSETARHEILHGRASERPPALPLPMLDGSGFYPPV